MKIVRKRLSVDEIQPSGTRWNSGTDTVQTTPDGGTTWNDAPGLDIRHADSFRLPPLTGGSAQCDAAARMAAYVNVQVDNFLNAGSLAQAATGALGVLLILAGGAGIIIDAILAAMDVLITIGSTAISTAFTVTVYEQLKCTFYCHIGADGQMSAAQLAAFQDDVFANYSSTIYSTMITIGSFTGEVQYSNAGVERSETGDCDTCACDHCFEIDTTTQDGSAYGLVIQGGSYVPGTGLIGQYVNSSSVNDVYGYWPFGGVLTVKRVELTYTKTASASGVNHFNALNPATGYGSTIIASNNFDDLGTVVTKTITVNDDCAGMGFDVNSGTAAVVCSIQKVRVVYTGTEFFGGDNC